VVVGETGVFMRLVIPITGHRVRPNMEEEL
jgi:hypothetical protein